MWSGDVNRLIMTEGDYGVELPVTITGVTLDANDSLRFSFVDSEGNLILEKDYSEIVDNEVALSFTEEESAQLPAGAYAYSIDWYQDSNFLCNLVVGCVLRVVDKA